MPWRSGWSWLNRKLKRLKKKLNPKIKVRFTLQHLLSLFHLLKTITILKKWYKLAIHFKRIPPWNLHQLVLCLIHQRRLQQSIRLALCWLTVTQPTRFLVRCLKDRWQFKLNLYHPIRVSVLPLRQTFLHRIPVFLHVFLYRKKSPTKASNIQTKSVFPCHSITCQLDCPITNWNWWLPPTSRICNVLAGCFAIYNFNCITQNHVIWNVIFNNTT